MKKLLIILGILLVTVASAYAYFQLRVQGTSPASCYANAQNAANAECDAICQGQGHDYGYAALDSCHTTGAMPAANGMYTCGIYCSNCVCNDIEEIAV